MALEQLELARMQLQASMAKAASGFSLSCMKFPLTGTVGPAQIPAQSLVEFAAGPRKGKDFKISVDPHGTSSAGYRPGCPVEDVLCGAGLETWWWDACDARLGVGGLLVSVPLVCVSCGGFALRAPPRQAGVCSFVGLGGVRPEVVVWCGGLKGGV